MKDSIQCHSGTKKEEVLAFVEKHKGEKINLHYENNIYDTWGDDDEWNYDTSDDKQYKDIIDTINNHYIHNIKVI